MKRFLILVITSTLCLVFALPALAADSSPTFDDGISADLLEQLEQLRVDLELRPLDAGQELAELAEALSDDDGSDADATATNHRDGDARFDDDDTDADGLADLAASLASLSPDNDCDDDINRLSPLHAALTSGRFRGPQPAVFALVDVDAGQVLQRIDQNLHDMPLSRGPARAAA